MYMRFIYFAIELKTTLLNLGLVAGALIILCQKCKHELKLQLEDFDKHRNQHNKEIGASLQNANSNLNFNKTLQWNYIYYAVLLYGPIIGLAISYREKALVQLILTIAANLVFNVGLYLTIDAQFQIRSERLSIIRIQLLLLSKRQHKERSELNEAKRIGTKYLSHPHITLTVMITMIVGYLICLSLTMLNTTKLIRYLE